MFDELFLTFSAIFVNLFVLQSSQPRARFPRLRLTSQPRLTSSLINNGQSVLTGEYQPSASSRQGESRAEQPDRNNNYNKI